MARRGAQFWRGQLEAWHRSDLTHRDYFAQHGLSEKSFYRWRGKEKEALAAGQSSLTLVPVRVSALTSGDCIVQAVGVSNCHQAMRGGSPTCYGNCHDAENSLRQGGAVDRLPYRKRMGSSFFSHCIPLGGIVARNTTYEQDYEPNVLASLIF